VIEWWDRRGFMKRYVIGFLLGVLLTALANYGWQYWKLKSQKEQLKSENDTVDLMETGRTLIENVFPDADISEVNVSPNSNIPVNYVCDKKYAVEVRYKRHNRKRIVQLPICKYKNVWITPNDAYIFNKDFAVELSYFYLKH
jgi:hypothetical protein